MLLDSVVNNAALIDIADMAAAAIFALACACVVEQVANLKFELVIQDGDEIGDDVGAVTVIKCEEPAFLFIILAAAVNELFE